MSNPIIDDLNSAINETKRLKSPKPKRPKYVTADNCKLDIMSDNDETYYLAWYVIDDADFGSSLGEYTRKQYDADAKKKTSAMTLTESIATTVRGIGGSASLPLRQQSHSALVSCQLHTVKRTRSRVPRQHGQRWTQ